MRGQQNIEIKKKTLLRIVDQEK